jgi:hypothetical protein
MTDEIRRKTSPLIEQAMRVRQTGAVQAPARAEPRNRSTPRAMLNFIPDSDGLAGLIDGAMQALSRGIRWARGSILNLLV